MTVQRQPISATGVRGFLQWLQTKQPYLYRRVAKQISVPQLAGLAAVDPIIGTAATGATSSTLADTLKTLVLSAGQLMLSQEQLKAQQKIIDLQLERARAGLPPADIDPTQYGLPAPSLNIGLDPSVKRMLTAGAVIAGGGFVLYLVFGGRRRRR